MAELWYYTQDGKPMEPVTQVELRRLAFAGLLKPTDFVWKEGMADWARANAASGLFVENEAITATEAICFSSGPSRPDGWQPSVWTGDVHRSRWADADDEDVEDAERLRRQRRPYPQRRGMGVGLKVSLLLGGSLVALIAVAVGLSAVRSHERARAQAQAFNRRQAFRFNQPPGFNPPRFNVPMHKPIEQPPQFMGPITVGPQETVLKKQLNDTDSRVHVQLHEDLRVFDEILRCKVFTVAMTGGKTYTIRLKSLHFDSALVIQDSSFVQVADDDDSGGGPLGLDALITFPCRRTGDYRVIAAALHDGTGPFTLSIKEE